jgi:hypothetical protein
MSSINPGFKSEQGQFINHFVMIAKSLKPTPVDRDYVFLKEGKITIIS